MTVKSIYLARHGYRANWLPKPHPPNPTGIDSDPPLAPHGVEQARELADYFTTLPESDKPQFILTSPFYRCVETAQPIANTLSLKVVLERGVGEWYKKDRSVVPAPANYDTLSSFFTVLSNEKYWHRDNTVGVIPDLSGETEEEIFDRAKLFWTKFIPVFEARFPEIETILIITHAATKIALGLALLKLSGVRDYIDDDNNILRAGACSLDRYNRSESGWTLIMNGNCDFLTKGEEMNWTFHFGFEAGSDEDIKARREEEERKKKKQSATNVGENTFPRTDDSGESEEFKDFYVTVNIPTHGRVHVYDEPNKTDSPRSKINIIKPSAKLQLSGLHDTNPLIKISNNSNQAGNSESGTNPETMNNMNIIDGRIYSTNWRSTVGTDLIFDDYGELIGKVNEHLVCQENVKLTPKNLREEDGEDKETEKNEAGSNDVSNADEDIVEGDTKNEFQSAFLKKAIKQAKKKASSVNM